jgi:hypothetical protein
MRVSVVVLLAVLVTFTADAVRGGTRVSAVEAATANPCAAIATALGPDQSGRTSCEHLRTKGGRLVISAELAEESSTREMLRPGQRCPGGYVGASKQPPSQAKYFEYFDLTFTVQDERTLEFEGWHRMFSSEQDGEFAENGRACGADVGGTIRLVEGRWRLVGDRYTGCSEVK